MGYNNVFGNDTVPPAQYGFQALTLTTNQSASWPYNYSGDGLVISKIMEVTCAVGNAFTLPAANEVSTGEDFLIRNVGSNTLTLKNADGTTISTIPATASTYFYIKDNTTTAGIYGQVAYGVGSASISAAALVGYGLQAAAALINVAFPVATTSALNTIISTTPGSNQAALYNYTGGAGSLNFSASASLGNAFWMMFANNGTGTVTLDPFGAELIDGASSKTVQPGESLLVLCSGSALYTVGYGRSTIYQFTQLVLDVSAAGTFTLTSAQAANKLLTFIGNPGGTVTVVVPSVVAIYYVQSSISTAQLITVKTAAGTGVNVPQSQRVICICDATNVSAAQSVAVTSVVSYPDGSAAAPSANFATSTNTGFYKKGTSGIGFAVSGVEVGYFNSDGSGFTVSGALTVLGAASFSGVFSVVDGNFRITGSSDASKILKFEVDGLTTATTRTLTVPDANLTIVGLDITQTLTNKTLNLASNTLAGTTAQFNAALSDNDFATQAGVETLTNKTLNLTNNSLSMTIAQLNTAISDGNVPVTDGTGAFGTWAINISGTAGGATTVTGSSSNGYGNRFVSSSGPSGGADGDIWYQT